MILISNGVPIAHRQTNHRPATPVSINELLWVREFLHQLKQMGQAKNVHEVRTIRWNAESPNRVAWMTCKDCRARVWDYTPDKRNNNEHRVIRVVLTRGK